jgi:hypothetical protein
VRAEKNDRISSVREWNDTNADVIRIERKFHVIKCDKELAMKDLSEKSIGPWVAWWTVCLRVITE